jgi:NAD(P)-dependent dehydrogenase (short-subunit alcohol dehydrogenase family)
MGKFTGKVSLITGASSGIGRGAALEFAAEGSKLALVGRNVDNLTEAKKECLTRANGVLGQEDILLIVADLALEADTRRVVEEAIGTFKRLDVLVNSAGILLKGSVESTPLEVYDNVMNINVRSVFHLTQLAIPHLKQTKGSIVNVSSVTGLRAFPGVVAYNLSKAAIDQLTRTAALELAENGVRVNAVNPGVIITEVHKRGGMSDADYEKFLEHSKTTHALGRPGTTDEVAKSIAFLASEDSSFTTGVTLAIDGGRSQMCPR